MERDDVVCALKDAGCCEEYIQKFLRVMKRGTREELLCLLACRRACLLEQIHGEQKKLECLDDLRTQMKQRGVLYE